MKVTDLLAGATASKEDILLAELILNRLRQELGLLRLPGAIARILPLVKKPEPQPYQFASQGEFQLAVLSQRYQPLQAMHELITAAKDSEHADVVVGNLLVEVSVEFARLHYALVRQAGDFPRFAETVYQEKSRDPFMTAEIVRSNTQIEFLVTDCLYIKALHAVGLSQIAHRICDPYVAYCAAHQPLLEGYLTSAIGYGQTHCQFGYRLI